MIKTVTYDDSVYALVPIEPTNELLMSMAVRYDHGLGMDGYYDNLIKFANPHGITHQQKLNYALTIARQLHEEVVGTGFYKFPDVSDISKE